MTKECAHYRQLERRLWMARWVNEGRESPEEDVILDEMEQTWLQLNDEDQAVLRQEPPRCWPTESPSLPPQFAGGPYTSAPAPWVYEGFQSPLDAILDADAT
jgi:hypothetical protein